MLPQLRSEMIGAMPVTVSETRFHPASAGPWGESVMVRVSGIDVRARRLGSGRALVAVHGFGDRSDTWAPIATRLADSGLEVIAPDLPGFGASDRPSGVSYAHQVQAERLLATLDALNLKSFALLGHSLGGLIAMELVLTAPDRVSALVIEASALPVSFAPGRVARRLVELADRGQADRVAAWLRSILSIPGLGALAVRAASGTWISPATLLDYLAESPGSAEVLLRIAVTSPSADLVARLASLRVPTLVIWGGRDSVIGPRFGARLAGSLLATRFVLYPEAGHSPHADQSERFVADLTSFLGPER